MREMKRRMDLCLFLEDWTGLRMCVCVCVCGSNMSCHGPIYSVHPYFVAAAAAGNILFFFFFLGSRPNERPSETLYSRND